MANNEPKSKPLTVKETAEIMGAEVVYGTGTDRFDPLQALGRYMSRRAARRLERSTNGD